MKRLKNINVLSELPFCKDLSVIKSGKVLGRYAVAYKIELIDKKGSLSQL